MAKNFASLAFTPAVQKQLQEQYGSRSAYARMEKQVYQDGLTENEQAFIAERDSFYMASIGANGFPYIQHRGGPHGFVQAIDANTVAFIDVQGNQQFISVGNISERPNVSLIFMDYPHRTRLKIYATAEVVPLESAPDLVERLMPAGFKARPQRLIKLHMEAYDWNCPQHITPRFTQEELVDALDAQRDYVEGLEREVARMKVLLAK
ncbi:MAG: pyridoxamine 5'-phosphate oxidase family protein [Flavobacteriales bacterium]|nr:pyridoxamine 5'-phosphate oxidase family protein [Flavobacteriales bacterium]